MDFFELSAQPTRVGIVLQMSWCDGMKDESFAFLKNAEFEVVRWVWYSAVGADARLDLV